MQFLWASLKFAGTVITNFFAFLFKYSSALSIIFPIINEEISSKVKCIILLFLLISINDELLCLLDIILKGKFSFSNSFFTSLLFKSLPINLFISYIVLSPLFTKYSIASSPLNIEFSSKIVTIDGVVCSPSLFGIISTPPFLKTPIQEKVVPKSKPMAKSIFESTIF